MARITSKLDNDLYKITMGAAVVKLYPNANVKYSLFNRGGTVFPEGFAKKLREAVDEMAYLPDLNASQIAWLKINCPFLSNPYIDFFVKYKYNPEEVVIWQNDAGELSVIIEGPWYSTIYWEVPLMSLISELYFEMTGQKPNDNYEEIARKKGKRLEEMGAYFADFGSRRRFSLRVHDYVVNELKTSKTFIGTSNVLLAYLYGVKPIGTEAHEWIMFHAAKYGYRMANSIALGRWVDVYHGDLGIALTDTFTTDDFFKSFDMMYAKLFDGVRHDSDDAIVFANKTIAHYKRLGIDPLSKTIIFSDGLNVDEVKRIHEFCKGKIKDGYGIGTHFSNDVGVKPLNIVIKMIAAQPNGQEPWVNTCKLSDVRGKHTGAIEAIELCKTTLGIK
jgi:nicotinate phosphoribosyltransferase